ncbi:MAG: toprim domain-containing protein [Flavobacteriaceae bacterium]|nr:MAG: toprim domain-containing protein [Flavobacteriaceae bacterium]
MNIATFKKELDILEIGKELGLQINNKGQCLCPFHKDKKPSLMFSREKQIATCFSGNCTAGTMDVIDLVQKFYSWELPETLKWLESVASTSKSIASTGNLKPSTIHYQELFKKLQPKLKQSSNARNYLESRHLDYKKLEAAFNNGKDYASLKHCIIFPLKDKNGQIVSLYGRSIYKDAKYPHFYTKNRQGLYPKYPPAATKKLIIIESIIDATTLEQHFTLPKDTAILAAYGTNGITPQHTEAVSYLKSLEEIILWLDADHAGKKATEKYAKELAEKYPDVQITKVPTLDGEDINSLLDSHTSEIFTQFFENRTQAIPAKQLKKKYSIQIETHKTNYQDEHLHIQVLGKLDIKNLGALRVTLVVKSKHNMHYIPVRNTLDLYHGDRIEKFVRTCAEKLETGTSFIRKALNTLTENLEHHRLQQIEITKQQQQAMPVNRQLTQIEKQAALVLLKDKDFIKKLTQKLQDTGIVGEEKKALFLFTILLSHQMNHTLHAMVQGTSGSGKSHLIKKVADCMFNQNKIKRFTRVSEKSFYNYGSYDLQHCGIILEDYDGLGEEAQLAWRELQSNGQLSSSVSLKNEITGEIKSGEKHVYGPIASLVATTKFRLYEDNQSRVFTIAIDESEQQTEKVLAYMAQKSSKGITDAQEQQAVLEIQNLVSLLKPYSVQNKYRLHLPKTTQQRRRLTQMLHDFIEQITLLHQYNRQRIAADTQEPQTLITKLEDLELAVDLMFESIVLKTDELDGILRQFYENLKKYITPKGENTDFTQREIRQEFRISKSQTQRYFNELLELEYIQKSSVGGRNTFVYKIAYWDNLEKLRTEIRGYLYKQIQAYKDKS